VKVGSEPRCSCGARITGRAERVVQFMPQGAVRK
jgi:hypothetical protein